jgi:hypothetical protein
VVVSFTKPKTRVVVPLQQKRSLRRWPQWRGLLQDHKFKVGQSVSFTSGPFGRGGTSGIYKVVQLLPPEGDDYQYRIKSASEPHERVVKESQLNRVA